MAIAHRETLEKLRIQRNGLGGIDRIEPVPFVDETAQHDGPAALARLEEIVKAAKAGNIAENAMHQATLEDRIPGLCDCPGARDVDGNPTQGVIDADAAVHSLAAHTNKLGGCAVEPGSHHTALFVP